MVPKHASSNLSPWFLSGMEEKHGYDYISKYVEDNSELQGERCKWLVDEEDGTTTCSAQDRKSSDCLNYPNDDECRVGKLVMCRKD